MTTHNHIVVTNDEGLEFSHIAAKDGEGREYTYIVVTNDEGQEFSVVVVLKGEPTEVKFTSTGLLTHGPWVEFYLGSEGREGLYLGGYSLNMLADSRASVFYEDMVLSNTWTEPDGSEVHTDSTGEVIDACIISGFNLNEAIRYARLRSMGML